MSKIYLKKQATKLRKRGRSLKEISKLLNISKSTAGKWCADIKISERGIVRLNKIIEKGNYFGRIKGSQMQRDKKNQIINDFEKIAEKELSNISERDLLMIGLGLHLGEGNKGGNGFQFTNSNPKIINAIIKWLKQFNFEKDQLYCNIIINSYYKNSETDIKKEWIKITKISEKNFKKTIFIQSKLKKIDPNFEDKRKYLGTLILRAYKSSKLQYRIISLCNEILKKIGN